VVGRAAAFLVHHLARPTWFKAGRTVSGPASVVLSHSTSGKLVNSYLMKMCRGSQRAGAGRSFTSEAARRLMEPHAFEPAQDGRSYIEKINGPFLFDENGTPGKASGSLFLALLCS
jgi:hypothetical protein